LFFRVKGGVAKKVIERWPKGSSSRSKGEKPERNSGKEKCIILHSRGGGVLAGVDV